VLRALRVLRECPARQGRQVHQERERPARQVSPARKGHPAHQVLTRPCQGRKVIQGHPARPGLRVLTRQCLALKVHLALKVNLVLKAYLAHRDPQDLPVEVLTRSLFARTASAATSTGPDRAAAPPIR